MNDKPIPPLAQAPRKRRWWLYILISFGGLVLVALISVVLLFAYAKSLVKDYTASSPRPIPKVQPNPARLKELAEQWETFRKAVERGDNPGPFEISADDLNLFMANNKELRDYVHLVITNNQLVAEFSAPISRTGRPELDGRYVNGVAKINIGFQDGWLTVTLGGVQANGKKVPDWILKRFPQENMLKQLDRNKDVVNLFQQLESIRPQDGKIVLTPVSRGK